VSAQEVAEAVFSVKSEAIGLPKISNISDFSDYRPIAILPCLSKAFEVCMCGQMVNNLLDPLQSGFKANHSTTTALLKVVDDLSKAADLKCGSVLTLLDFCKVFDSIVHEPFLMKLSKNSISFLYLIYLSISCLQPFQISFLLCPFVDVSFLFPYIVTGHNL
jgi:hypothetical protein